SHLSPLPGARRGDRGSSRVAGQQRTLSPPTIPRIQRVRGAANGAGSRRSQRSDVRNHMTHEQDVALAAVELAAKSLLDEYARFQAIPNAPAEISTAADKGSQEIILQHLQKHFPGDGYSAEEATASIAGRSADAQRLWIIDPIDGTRGF